MNCQTQESLVHILLVQLLTIMFSATGGFIEVDGSRDGGTDQHLNRVTPITKTHPTLTPAWKLQCNEVGLDEFSLFWPS